jgi:hypothetical protein
MVDGHIGDEADAKVSRLQEGSYLRQVDILVRSSLTTMLTPPGSPVDLRACDESVERRLTLHVTYATGLSCLLGEVPAVFSIS